MRRTRRRLTCWRRGRLGFELSIDDLVVLVDPDHGCRICDSCDCGEGGRGCDPVHVRLDAVGGISLAMSLVVTS